MTEAQRAHAFSEAPNYTDPDAFVSDMLLSPVFLDPDNPELEIDMLLTEPLRRIWIAANVPFRDFLTELGLTQTGLSRRYCIPLRTVQGWAGETRTPPEYLRLLLARAENYIN